MTQLDPFIIYTVKLAMDFKSVETIPRDTIQENLILPDTMAHEQWINSTIDLSKIINQDQGQIQAAIDDVHRQQRIYLDTLHLLQKSILPNEFHKRLNEPIWFAAQVLNKNCQIRHLEYFTDTIQPLASKVHDSIEKIRLVTRRLLHKQQSYKQQQQQQQQQDSFFSSFFSSFSSSNISYKENNFYHTEQNQDLLQRLEPHLISLYYHWTTFEKALYECYVHTVFGKSHHSNLLWEQQNSTIQQLPNQLFNDQFTQLLPITLERAINLRIIDLQAIQSLEPIAFVAIPRLAILAGVTWLAHLTGWRTDLSSLPIWIKPHIKTLNRISSALEKLEFQLLKNQSEDAHHSFVQRYQTLEQILVSGRPMQEDDNNTACQQLEKSIFLDICIIADSVLSSHSTQAFTIVLSHLFRHFGQQYDILFEESEDAIPLEQTVMDLAI
ncbi:hypothetical protein INT48_000162 [Thamnidium elegans]|uniref:Uncharacterized protein n=1 Tax=Thamnidium elegans TaxID=101142 RepID=A0A8H7SYR9_9FUNG|nr:hypothetical protein INT48_000162 [Thamnidium elegans]